MTELGDWLGSLVQPASQGSSGGERIATVTGDSAGVLGDEQGSSEGDQVATVFQCRIGASHPRSARLKDTDRPDNLVSMIDGTRI
jgi:hypothetical protein